MTLRESLTVGSDSYVTRSTVCPVADAAERADELSFVAFRLESLRSDGSLYRWITAASNIV